MTRPRSGIIHCSGCGQANSNRASVCTRCGTALGLPEPMRAFPEGELPGEQTATRRTVLPFEEEQTSSSPSWHQDPLTALATLASEVEDATQRTFLPPLRDEDIFAEEEALEGSATRVTPRPERTRAALSRPPKPSPHRSVPSPSLRPKAPAIRMETKGSGAGVRPLPKTSAGAVGREASSAVASPGASPSQRLSSRGVVPPPVEHAPQEETRLDKPIAGRVPVAEHPPPERPAPRSAPLASGKPTPPPAPVAPPPAASPVVRAAAPSPPAAPAKAAPAEAERPPAPGAISAPVPAFDPTPPPPPPQQPSPPWEPSPLDPEANLYSPGYREAMLDQDSDAFAPTPSVVRMLKGAGGTGALQKGSFWKNPLYLALIALGVLLTVVLVWGFSTAEAPKKPAPLPPPPAAYETPAPPKRPDGPEPVEKVALGFHIDPQSADVLLWVNKEKYPSPPARGSIDVPKGASVEVTVAAPGYQPQQRSLVVNKTEIIDIRLTPLKKK